MRGAHKQRGMAAPRVAQELPAVQHQHQHQNQRSNNSPRRGLSDKSRCWCCGSSTSSSSSSRGWVWGRPRTCGCSWRVSPLFSRKATRQSFAVVLLCLAGAFSLRGWRAAMMIESAPFGGGGGRWTTSSSDDLEQQQRLWLMDEQRSDQCGWEPGGPILFNVEHSKTKMHADANHWFHVAECFIGQRSQFKEYFAGMAGTDVYLKDADRTWNSKLTPMTRLLMMAGLTSVGVRAVHFVDGDHATFSFPPSAPRGKDDREDAGGLRGGGGSGRRKSASSSNRPEAGQIGVLRLDDVGRRDQFVVTTEQPLPDKLTVSARQSRKRAKWFPGEDDPRGLLRAIDNFCPISWLRKEQQEQRKREPARGEPFVDDRDQDSGNTMLPLPAYGGSSGDVWTGRRVARGLFATVVGGPGAGAAGKRKRVAVRTRKLVIYQRDRNRQLLNSEELVDELWDRVGHIGWTFTEIIHDDERHPCDLIDELAGADVLLTAHGFQSMLSIFMAPGSILFEVYPHKYYKAGYAPLARSLGLRYGYSQSPPVLPLTSWKHPSLETCMKWYWCRNYVQGSDVKLADDSLEVLISLMLQSLHAR